MRTDDCLGVLRDIHRHLTTDVSLRRVAKRAGWSPFHLQRAIRKAAGESPKQYVQRLRLERAAARLVTGKANVAQIARAVGFASHEVFTRAFRRQFGCTPALYRSRALAGVPEPHRLRHAAVVESAGPCIRLFHFPKTLHYTRTTMPTLSITRQERAAQPILFIRRRVAQGELQGMLAECFGKLYGHAQKAGLPLAGFPLARYVAVGPGLMTVDAAVPLVSPAAGEGEMQAGFLPAGPVALGIHGGVYEELKDTNAAIERWIEAQGYEAGGPHWEWYVTDPGEHPNPADWRTEVYWPLAK
jgi:AraC family transcriptional regulator